MTILPMPDIAETEPGSPPWWLARLMPRLSAQAERCDNLDDYYRNENDLPPMCKAVRDAYRRLMDMSRVNFAELIVEAVRERMTVSGFRTGATDDVTGDAEAWAMWQANALDADADLVHRAKLSMSCAYVIVGRIGDEVVITPEDPRQVYAEHDPIRRRRIRAALKVFHDELLEVDMAYLYLPGVVHRAVRAAPFAGEGDPQPAQLTTGGWQWQRPDRLPPGMMPVVSFLNRPDLYCQPQGEFESHIGHLDRIQYTVLNRLEVATLQAFRQRAIKGNLPQYDEEGNPIDYNDVFAADPGALWQIPETAELWESGGVDLQPLLQSVKDDVEHLAAVTRTPMHYFAPASANQSAEGASLARESLMFKVKDQLTQTGESWEQVMALAFAFAGDPERAERADMEVIWADPERSSMAERADAASKAEMGGLPWRLIMESIWQMTPQEIERAQAEKMNDALFAQFEAGDLELAGAEGEEAPPEEEEV